MTAPSHESLPRVDLFTDGACLGNPGPGGGAYLLRFADGAVEDGSGGDPKTTNNRMELLAAIEGMRSLDGPHAVNLCADSQYVVKGIGEWMAGWKQRGWRTAAKKPVMNVDLWQTMDELIALHAVNVEWTKGHAGHPENEACDRMASAQAENYKNGF